MYCWNNEKRECLPSCTAYENEYPYKKIKCLLIRATLKLTERRKEGKK